ncbi:hypothetical protein K461DRAFT_290771 [Myriangium duriaei CBS 260.36]|uniref:DUF8035 domain-containing protein n=1 Tax=Myriangium duriaei CBS 260.36 TaxID=1168546 RepID=A0A9P4MK05_9PEZI|nr:hypothetical protein K461DRAFT_290771 [Myriangium duriaei CBS 260.36]
MSRRYVDRYEERDRDYYDRRAPRGGYDEVDIEIDRERYDRRPARPASVVEERYRAPRQPDFLREDYGRDAAGPLVIRESEKVKEYQRDKGRTDMSVVGSRRGGSPPEERITKEDIIIKERFRDRDNVSESGRSRKSRAPREREEVIDDRRSEIRDGPRERPHREVEEEEIIIRRNDRDYSPPARRKEIVTDEREIYFRRGSSRPPPPREVEREEIYIRDERSPPRERVEREVDRQEITIRERDPSPRRYDREIERERVVIDERERSRPPPRYRSIGPPIAREREEFIFRRRRSPSPRPRSPTPPPRDYEREQIIIRRRESSPPIREPSPESIREPTPEPPREPSPEPMPLYRPPIIQHIYTHHHHIDHGLERARSPTPPPKTPTPPPPPPAKKHEESLEIEIRRRGIRGGQEFYEKDVILDRERDAVDRVKEEVQVTRKRSESSHPSREKDPGRRDSGRPLRRDMWTEVTKDLVSKTAIEKAGYDYEETSEYFYVIEYLKYEDVLRLVEMTEDIRREEKERSRDNGWKREDEDRASVTAGRPKERERIYEHDHIREIRKTTRDRDTRSVRSGRYR